MISAWRKFINKETADNERSYGQNGSTICMPPGIQKLDKELQKKFARGVHYNMKVIIKGDNRVGKTSLFLRLKGYGFEDDYTPTETLNVTSIDWNYKATDDIVKIDLWEAIDATSRKSVNIVDLKTNNDKEDAVAGSTDDTQSKKSVPMNVNNNFNGASNNNNNNNNNNVKSKMTITTTPLTSNLQKTSSPIPESARQSLAELSENFDVYKGAHAVLLVMDMTKSWTFKYVQAEFSKIPKHIPILVIANHRDQGHHRTVSAEQVAAFIDGLDRSPTDGTVMYTEASMKNGFGMKMVEKFFNIPFLKLQESSLLKQLELNRQEHLATKEELQLMQASTNLEYEQFLEIETIRRRQQADAMSPVNSGLRQLDEARREQIRNTTVSSELVTTEQNVKSIESRQSSNTGPVVASQNFVNDRLPSIVIGAKCPLPETKTIQLSSTSQQTAAATANHHQTNADDKTGKQDKDRTCKDSDESEEDEEPRANPLVAGYQSDLDSDDQLDQAK